MAILTAPIFSLCGPFETLIRYGLSLNEMKQIGKEGGGLIVRSENFKNFPVCNVERHTRQIYYADFHEDEIATQKILDSVNHAMSAIRVANLWEMFDFHVQHGRSIPPFPMAALQTEMPDSLHEPDVAIIAPRVQKFYFDSRSVAQKWSWEYRFIMVEKERS
jgi:hypothetical protein